MIWGGIKKEAAREEATHLQENSLSWSEPGQPLSLGLETIEQAREGGLGSQLFLWFFASQASSLFGIQAPAGSGNMKAVTPGWDLGTSWTSRVG